jgi:hypothetical protein
MKARSAGAWISGSLNGRKRSLSAADLFPNRDMFSGAATPQRGFEAL